MHDLGVLFVHGIGQQTEGETLVRATDAVVEHFETRFGMGGQVEVEAARLEPDTGPARAVLHLTPDQPGTAAPQTWLLAESWWAQSFRPAGFSALLSWTLGFLPFATLAHFGARCRSESQRLHRAPTVLARAALIVPWLGSVALLLLAPLLALGVITVSVLLAGLALIPLPLLQSPARWLQSKLAATLGDSGVLLTSRTNRAAMVEQIRSDLSWLAPHCRCVAVVAHSQGAALGWEALLGGVPSNVRLFLSHGSGLKKLLQLQVAQRPGSASLPWGWMTVIAEIAVVVFAVALVWTPVSGTAASAGIMIGAWLTLLCLGALPVSVLQTRRDSPPSRWELMLPAATAVSVILPQLFAWVAQPHWHWEVALTSTVFSAAVGWVALPRLSQRFPAPTDRLWLLGSMLGGIALACTVLLSADALRWQASVCLLIAVAVLAIGLLVAALDESVSWENVVGALTDRGITWRDWYATRDPVPAGPIAALGANSIPVTNMGQFHRDHTTYWENTDEFVADIGAALATYAGMPLAAASALAKARRRWRVELLAIAGTLAWWGIAMTLALKWAQLGPLGSQVLGYVHRFLSVLPFGAGESIARDIPALSSAELPWLGAFAVAAPILLTREALAWWWRRWDRMESCSAVIEGTHFHREQDPAFVWPLVFYVAGVLFFVLPTWAWILSLPFAVLLHSGLAGLFRRRAPEAPEAPPEDQPHP